MSNNLCLHKKQKLTSFEAHILILPIRIEKFQAKHLNTKTVSKIFVLYTYTCILIKASKNVYVKYLTYSTEIKYLQIAIQVADISWGVFTERKFDR